MKGTIMKRLISCLMIICLVLSIDTTVTHADDGNVIGTKVEGTEVEQGLEEYVVKPEDEVIEPDDEVVDLRLMG